jgi:hypothetical protein
MCTEQQREINRLRAVVRRLNNKIENLLNLSDDMYHVICREWLNTNNFPAVSVDELTGLNEQQKQEQELLIELFEYLQ